MTRLPSSLLAVLLLAGTAARADETPPSPFGVAATLSEGGPLPGVRFQFDFPRDCVIYADHLHFLTGDGAELTPFNMPAPIMDVDKASGEERKMFDRPFTADLALPAGSSNLVVKLQGCSNTICFFPEKHFYTVTRKGILASDKPEPKPPVEVSPRSAAISADWEGEARHFRIIARETGYIRAADFVPFLHRAATANLAAPADPLAVFKRAGLIVTLLLIIGGGIALNLTPCVLPLVPVNLAIIGAGGAARNRREGFLHGAIYGAGMALVYGTLGLIVVLTGAKFGALNSSVGFNSAIAAVFGVLALAMFGVLNLDFSRLGGGGGFTRPVTSRNRSIATFLLGSMAALLAGACVAPVVISVLLLASSLYAKGQWLGLALPFLLGLGMALPWPFAGASLAFLPRPGRWMTGVKYAFGVLILGFGIYYGHAAYALAYPPHPATDLAAAPGFGAAITGANQALTRALAQARANGHRVFIDFEASWCKNCLAMEATVFTQAEVRHELDSFVVVEYQAERPNESPAKEVLDYFGVIGLPTYIVLTPDK